MALDLRTRLVYYNNTGSPIGFIGWSAVYFDSKWTFDGWRTLDHYTFTYVLDGHCRYTEPDGRCLMFGPGDFFFCFPGIPHRIDPTPGEPFSEFWCSFSGPAFDFWRAAGILAPSKFVIHLEPIEHWLGRFESMFAKLRHDTKGQIVAVTSFQSLLAEAMAFEEHAATSGEDEGWIGQAKALLEAVERAEDLDLTEIAQMLNMSYSNFRRKFVALAGMPPGRYHTSKLMERACQWMYEGSITNKEIAQRCGFCNEFHFSERFKQMVGKSPRDFRKSLQNNQAVARNQSR
jgi:AraC-like DNA-binding protein